MEVSTFCVGRAKSASGGAREFQSRFNETFETRFRLAPKGSALIAKVTARSSGSLRLADLRSSSQTMSLMPGLPASSSKERFVLTLQVEGMSIVRQRDTEARAVPGDLFVVDACKPFQVETTKVVLKSIYLDADVLREAFPGVDRCTAVTVSTRHGTGRIARAAIEELFDPACETDEESIVRIAGMLPHALSVAFGHYLKSQAPWSRDDHHRERIKEFALRKLRDPYLDTHVIAKGVGLSIRHLHKLFESEPDTSCDGSVRSDLEGSRTNWATPCLMSARSRLSRTTGVSEKLRISAEPFGRHTAFRRGYFEAASGSRDRGHRTAGHGPQCRFLGRNSPKSLRSTAEISPRRQNQATGLTRPETCYSNGEENGRIPILHCNRRGSRPHRNPESSPSHERASQRCA